MWRCCRRHTPVSSGTASIRWDGTTNDTHGISTAPPRDRPPDAPPSAQGLCRPPQRRYRPSARRCTPRGVHFVRQRHCASQNGVTAAPCPPPGADGEHPARQSRLAAPGAVSAAPLGRVPGVPPVLHGRRAQRLVGRRSSELPASRPADDSVPASPRLRPRPRPTTCTARHTLTQCLILQLYFILPTCRATVRAACVAVLCCAGPCRAVTGDRKCDDYHTTRIGVSTFTLPVWGNFALLFADMADGEYVDQHPREKPHYARVSATLHCGGCAASVSSGRRQGPPLRTQYTPGRRHSRRPSAMDVPQRCGVFPGTAVSASGRGGRGAHFSV